MNSPKVDATLIFHFTNRIGSNDFDRFSRVEPGALNPDVPFGQPDRFKPIQPNGFVDGWIEHFSRTFGSFSTVLFSSAVFVAASSAASYSKWWPVLNFVCSSQVKIFLV